MNLIFLSLAVLSSWQLLVPLTKEESLVYVASICKLLSFYVHISIIVDQSPVQQQQVLSDPAVRR